jgi:hypothetical protein
VHRRDLLGGLLHEYNELHERICAPYALKELAGCLGVAPWGDEHIEDLPELIDRAVDLALLPGDPHLRFVHKPSDLLRRVDWPGSLGQQRREPKHPSIQRDVLDLDATLGEQRFDVAVRQAEAQVPADRQDDHVGREAEAGEGRLRDRSRARWALMPAVSRLERCRSQRNSAVEATVDVWDLSGSGVVAGTRGSDVMKDAIRVPQVRQPVTTRGGRWRSGTPCSTVIDGLRCSW